MMEVLAKPISLSQVYRLQSYLLQTSSLVGVNLFFSQHFSYKYPPQLTLQLHSCGST